ncbi:Methyltransferase domain-containing protein [Pseudomonas cuatrocienegasensis]|uniref:Methyltransferase domain-containing protein n=1 Tax=Pseudomonas cuatrocienegasensis TaxID=543360 RepID=A0ABY1BIC4_9PSED|nr:MULTISPECIES: methyltransferase [Pseudomonas]OEC33406.1 SAM-dependent methyltransferase [Pseudomonas sp. 21C1]SEQ93672.1 Methyltransferase domain-containing protein [Pseudomonas cuatrocienegasensis]
MSTCDLDLHQRFAALDAFLLRHQSLWRPRPFTELTLPWEAEHPTLAQWLRARSLEQAEATHNTPCDLPAPAPFTDLAQQSRTLTELSWLPQQVDTRPVARFNVDVPGRKWQQIQAFAQSLTFNQHPHHWLDWCAGKGHLGHLLARDGMPLTCLEHDPALVEDGQRLAQRLQLDAQHRQQDVMADDSARHLTPMHTAVALHACGDLHIRLMQLASAAGCGQLAIAPCCYNRTQAAAYQPLSMVAQASALHLSRDDLGLPLNETVTAPARVRQQRDQSMARRLAFDLLQRELRGVDSYLPTPSLPAAWLHKPFAQYCIDLGQRKGLTIDANAADWDALLARGWQRLAEVRNLELLRALFRRPLELWLVLDRALYLEEQGYQVRLGQFCPADLTPRNLLLLAERHC